jgi:hypothetical protein
MGICLGAHAEASGSGRYLNRRLASIHGGSGSRAFDALLRRCALLEVLQVGANTRSAARPWPLPGQQAGATVAVEKPIEPESRGSPDGIAPARLRTTPSWKLCQPGATSMQLFAAQRAAGSVLRTPMRAPRTWGRRCRGKTDRTRRPQNAWGMRIRRMQTSAMEHAFGTAQGAGSRRHRPCRDAVLRRGWAGRGHHFRPVPARHVGRAG